MKSICLFFAAMLAASPAAATVTIGGPQFMTASSACQPFMCASATLTNGGGTSPLSWPTEYQQVYLATLFGGSTYTITGVSFPVGSCVGGGVDGGTFTISLSTTNASILNSRANGTGLNVSNLSANLGSDNTVVYSGTLPAISGGTLTITFSTPFNYSAFRGNLLLDVQSSSPTNSPPFTCLALGQLYPLSNSPASFSRAWVGLGDGDYNTMQGLITTFVY